MAAKDEVEVKMPLSDPRRIRRRIRALGYRVATPRRRERNWLFDDRGRLRIQGRLLRLRQSGGEWSLTYKGPRTPGALKRRREIETVVDDGEACRWLLERIGFREAMRYERYRTTYTAGPDDPELNWDETPMGVYLELEGRGPRIRRMLAQLGLRIEDAEQRSYPELYQAWRRHR